MAQHRDVRSLLLPQEPKPKKRTVKRVVMTDEERKAYLEVTLPPMILRRSILTPGTPDDAHNSPLDNGMLLTLCIISPTAAAKGGEAQGRGGGGAQITRG